MSFTLLPAVDVADGRTVRIVAGDARVRPVPGSPLETALRRQSEGASWIHLVDVDAALGRGSNAELLASVIGALDVAVQLSAGVRDDESLKRALATGCARVVLGTAALEDLPWCARAIAVHGERIAVALDVRVDERPERPAHHRLVARGSSRDSGDLWAAIEHLDRVGCERVIVTDVDRDGAMLGPNVELCRAVARTTAARVIASGGIATIEDLVHLASPIAPGSELEGAVVGGALHTGRFTLSDALAAVADL